jgi:hypothetical protein
VRSAFSRRNAVNSLSPREACGQRVHLVAELMRHEILVAHTVVAPDDRVTIRIRR